MHLSLGRSDNHSAVHISAIRPTIQCCTNPAIQWVAIFLVNLDVHDCVTAICIGIVSGFTSSPTSIATLAIPNIRIKMVVNFGCDLTEEFVVVCSINAAAATMGATEFADLCLQGSTFVKSQDEVLWSIGASPSSPNHLFLTRLTSGAKIRSNFSNWAHLNEVNLTRGAAWHLPVKG